MHVLKKIFMFSSIVLVSTSVFARDRIDDLVERMNPPKSIEDPRNAICAKNDRGFMRYNNRDVMQRAEKSNVQLALDKWGRLHFPNARDAQKCPILNFYQLTFHWRSAYELPTGTGMWDDDAMKTFERLVEMQGKSSTVATNKSTDESTKSGSIEIFGLKIGEPFNLSSCEKVRWLQPCVIQNWQDNVTITLPDDRKPSMLVSHNKHFDGKLHHGMLATLRFAINSDDENISKFIEKFGKPRVEKKPTKNSYGVSGYITFYKWSNQSGLIEISCSSLGNECVVDATSQQYLKLLREEDAQRQSL